MGDGGVGSGSVDSGCHQLSENIWFVWSKMSYSGDMEGCHACARRTDGRTDARNVKIDLEFWKQNSQKGMHENGCSARQRPHSLDRV